MRVEITPPEQPPKHTGTVETIHQKQQMERIYIPTAGKLTSSKPPEQEIIVASTIGEP